MHGTKLLNHVASFETFGHLAYACSRMHAHLPPIISRIQALFELYLYSVHVLCGVSCYSIIEHTYNRTRSRAQGCPSRARCRPCTEYSISVFQGRVLLCCAWQMVCPRISPRFVLMLWDACRMIFGSISMRRYGAGCSSRNIEVPPNNPSSVYRVQ